MATIIHLPIVRPAEAAIGSLSAVGSASYDLAINGTGLILAISPETPYVRETAQYKKDQFDAGAEAGEQSLTNWWLRSQSSYHGGAGLLYLEQPGADQNIARIRFDASKNVDVWTPGKVTRLPDTTQVISSGSACGGLVGARRGTDNYAVVAFGTALQARKMPDGGGDSTITYTWGGTNTIQSLACDGANYWAAETGGIYSGPVDNASNGAKVWNSGTLVLVGWVKQRLMAGIDNKIYELVGGSPPTLPTAKYTHPNTDWRWTAFADSPKGILAAGYSGDESAIYSFELDAQGVSPTLTSGVLAARLPVGERVHSIFGYAGTFLAIGTSKGLRIGSYDANGGLFYGPLTLECTSPVKAITGRGNYIYATTSRYVDGESCLTRINLGQQIDEAGRFAYATDILAPTAQTGDATGVAVANGRLLFVVDTYGLILEGAGAGSGRAGWLRTSRVRYSTIEPKLFKMGQIRGVFPGTVVVYATTSATTEAAILNMTAPAGDPPEFELPSGPFEWLQLRVELSGAAAAELRSYQLKSLPATPRQRLIQLPVQVADRLRDRNGKELGYKGYAWQLTQYLEELEVEGDVVLYQSLLPAAEESRRCIIERINFQQVEQATAVNGLGGIALLVLRTVD
jgi:hypothetical protein